MKTSGGISLNRVLAASMYKMGPVTLPCGTPVRRETGLERTAWSPLLAITLILRLVTSSIRIRVILPGICASNKHFLIVLCGIRSNAWLLSSDTASVDFPCDVFSCTAETKVARCSSVPLSGR